MEQTLTLHTNFAAHYPTIPTESQEALIGLSRHILLIEVAAKLDQKYENDMEDLLKFKKCTA
jgi:hypothetical protein